MPITITGTTTAASGGGGGYTERCSIYHSANQSITQNTLTALAFDSERADTDTMHNTATNNSRITFTTAGTYVITANITWAGNTSGHRQLALRLNGTTYIANAIQSSAGSADSAQSVVREYSFSAGDYIEVMVAQGSGGNLNVLASGNYSPEATARRVG